MKKIHLLEKRFSLWALLLVIVLGDLLSACHPLQPVFLRKNKSPCLISCFKRLNICKDTCRNTCYYCKKLEKNSACLKYLHYKHAIETEGKYLTLQLNSFHDPLQCRKTTCDCIADYDVCKQACHGMVYKQLQAAPGCS